MNAVFVVFSSMLLDEYFRFEQRGEDLSVEQFVAESAVERLAVAVLPWTAGLDVVGRDAGGRKPLLDFVRNELWAIIGSNVGRRAVRLDQSLEHGDDIAPSDVEGDENGQALSSEVVDHRKNLDLPAVVETIEQEVVAPYVILSLGDGPPLTGWTSAAALPCLADDLQTLLSTDAAHALPIHDPSFPPQLRRQAAMTVPRKLPHQLQDPFPYAH